MRIALPSATIAVISAASTAAAEEDRAANYSTKSLARDVDHPSKSSSNFVLQRAWGKECKLFSEDAANDADESETDVGLLGCGAGEACVEDETSPLGGRCTTAKAASTNPKKKKKKRKQQRPTKPQMAAFPSRRTSRPLLSKARRLQVGAGGAPAAGDGEEEDAPFVCPANCPQAFCDCAQDDGDAEVCAPELHEVCLQSLLPECVPDSYLPFYVETYCPFAGCIVADTPYEECSCGYYRDYCTTYYAYEESLDKCAVSECCNGSAKGDKWLCLPGMQPTFSPTGEPTITAVPSASPTISSKPTISSAPTISPAPSASPTISPAPTASFPPTAAKSASPSAAPTLTSMPTPSPVVPPTASPSGSPSYAPSGTPTAAPTVSAAPTKSVAPSASPTATSAPTVSSAPTDVPSTSAAPTDAPSGSPTISSAPTAAPVTAEPTTKPTPAPTAEPTTPIPTDLSTSTPTGADGAAPVPDVPTADRGPVIQEPSAGMASVPSLVATLLVGVGGALWMLA
ncbi:hypothetical protein ACHAXT_002373 [Thalassiosira profunda]